MVLKNNLFSRMITETKESVNKNSFFFDARIKKCVTIQVKQLLSQWDEVLLKSQDQP